MAKETHSRAKSAMSGHHKSSGKAHSVHVRRGHSGGFIATNHHAPGDDGTVPPSEEHVVPDMESLQAHMQDQMGDQPPAPAPQPPAAGAAPAAGAQPGM